MIITKEQQEAWVSNYAKEKHTTDECIGFIDGVNKALDVVNKNFVPMSCNLRLPILTENFGDAGWTAQLEGIAGMVTQGETEEEAINELMISIKVMLFHKRGNIA